MEYKDSKHISLFIFAFSLIICVYRIFLIWNYYSFSVPASDFLSFRNRAILMERGEFLWGNKRLPLFPLMMVIFAQPFKLFGIEYPYLIGAHVINIISVGLSVPASQLI